MATTKPPKKRPTKARALPLRPADDADVVADLKGEEGYFVATLGSERWHFCICGLGVMRCRREGFGLFDALQQVGQHGQRIRRRASSNGAADEAAITRAMNEDEATLDDLFVLYARVFFGGISPFYALSFDDFAARLRMKHLQEMQAAVLEHFQTMVPAARDDAEDDVEQGAGTEGNAPTGS